MRFAIFKNGIFYAVLFSFLFLACERRAQREDPDTISHYRTWSHYLGDPGRSHFSALRQIDSTNVKELLPVWTYESGGLSPGRNTQIQTNPLVIGNKLFSVNAGNKLFAIDAATGKELWTFDPPAEDGTGLGLTRGLAYWPSDGENPARIFFSSGPLLYAISPEDGLPIPEYGMDGKIDLRENLGREPETIPIVMTTPGAIYNDLYIIGSRTSESPGAAPGHIRAYNVLSGEMVWIFRTIPHPGEFGYETWPPEAYKDDAIGGANNWAGMAVDTEQGIVFVPTGSAAFDWYGGNRLGDNLFANTLLALNARTGERIWHFQMVRHDLWDRDLPAPPNLIEIEKDGELIPAVAQVTKSGHVFIFNRLNGESLFPIQEQEYPPSPLTGDSAARRQPLPLKPMPMARQRLSESDLYAPDELAFVDDFIDHAQNENPPTVLEKFRQITSAGQFVPIDTTGVILYPGADGGAEWGGAAVDPRTGIMYVNSNEMAWIVKMKKVAGTGDPEDIGRSLSQLHCARCHGGNLQGLGDSPALRGDQEGFTKATITNSINKGVGSMPPMPNLTEAEIEAIGNYITGLEEVTDHRAELSIDIPYTISGFGRFKDQRGFPVVKPPWGTLNAIDLNSGTYLWQVPLGHEPGFNDPEHPVSGTENYGGPLITAGGLLFIAATKDEKFRVFSMSTGELLWEYQLPAGGYATPATYEIDGRQYVVIACGGGKMGTPSGDQYFAFSLPVNH